MGARCCCLATRALKSWRSRCPSGGHFYRPAHATVFATITTLYLRGDAADPITVAAELTRTGDIARAGGAPYLHQLVQATPTVANAEHYALIVRERAALREVITANLTAANQAMRGEGTASEIIATQQQALQAVYDDTGDDGLDLLGPALDLFHDDYDRRAASAGALSGISTGLIDLDALTNGLQ
ncbi:DnaB-like helicase N-terminal domain-containing protein, partial [Streptomyces sp. PA03-6a]|nr:DnaB-like helicase N-terminal domain-containing protein [Streptomyces sp. PA03-6a]